MFDYSSNYIEFAQEVDDMMDQFSYNMHKILNGYTKHRIMDNGLEIVSGQKFISKTQIYLCELPPSAADRTEIMHLLFYIAAQDLDFDPLSALTIYSNIMRLVFSNSDEIIREAFKKSGLNPNVITKEEFLELLDIDYKEVIESEEYGALVLATNERNAILGIYFNLITKKLTTQNNTQWLENRSAYCRAALAGEENETVVSLMPALNFSVQVNNSMASCFAFKTAIFKEVRSVSRETNHALYPIAKITMVYFAMAELAGFATVYQWLILRNKGLLAWNGLSKHLPFLKAAVNQFVALGEDAPYCKFLYPPEEMTAFQDSRIGIFVALALEVSRLQGNSPFENDQGFIKKYLPEELAIKVKELLQLFGDANTQVKTRIFANANEKMDALNSGMKKRSQDGPANPN